MEKSTRHRVKQLARCYAAAGTKDGFASAMNLLRHFGGDSMSLDRIYRQALVKTGKGHFGIADGGNLLVDGADISHWAVTDEDAIGFCDALLEMLGGDEPSADQ